MEQNTHRMSSLPDWKHSALLLLGHGSTTNKESSQPTYSHAQSIRDLNIFSEVHTAFWKEPVFFSDALKQIHSKNVYIVPNFISEGFYTKGIIPREFGMTGRVSSTASKNLFYCDPVGGHAAMTQVLLKQAEEVLSTSEVSCAEIDLILVGHGTPKNRKSTEAIKRQVQRIAEQKIFRNCVDAYMEEAPWISHWDELTDSGNVVVVPFFIADGLHSYEDIPELMGIPKPNSADGLPRPISLRGKNLWYARSIGNQREMVSVILDMVRDFKPDAPFCSSCPR